MNANTLKVVTAFARNDVWTVKFGTSTNNQIGLALAQHWNRNR